MSLGNFSRASLLVGFSILTACGGTTSDSNNSSAIPQQSRLLAATAIGGATDATTAANSVTPAVASHFLAQATFGPTIQSINQVAASGPRAWLDTQFSKSRISHRTYVQSMADATTGGIPTQGHMYESIWKQAVTGDDQLRQRVTYALSQIFVISMADSNVGARVAGVASYYDMLAQNAFGNFRDLLQGVALHPMMGMYLSHMHNQKEAGPRLPDENFAREVMQLMTIGLYQINPDASYITRSGKPIPTYTHDDVAGLAKVFTGLSWAGPDQSLDRFFGTKADAARDWTPMQMYSAYHSTSSKSFLGTTIAAGGSGEADVKTALDTLFNHPNVGPFIGRLLIQRLVSSNPTPAYVGRVAGAFNNNGAGVRGDMKAVIRAVLLDPEAADTGNAKKLREPVLRLTHWMRAFGATSDSGRYLLSSMDDPLAALNQTPLRSPSVFNFFRPQYSPPNTSLAAAKMVAPEMQITGEPSVTGYINFMQTVVAVGLGMNVDVHSDYTEELLLTAQPTALLDRLNLLLYAGTMSSTLRAQIATALLGVTIPAYNGFNTSEIESSRKRRIYVAVYLAMISPEYVTQR